MNSVSKKIISGFAVAAMVACVQIDSTNAAAPLEKSFQVKPGGTLQVSVDDGSIIVFTSKKDEVTVHVRGSRDNNFTMDVRGNTVRVIDHGGWNNDSPIELTVPVQFNLDLDAHAGDITVRDDIEGNVEIRTGGGDVSLAAVTGPVNASTSGGDINAGNLNGKGRLTTSGGTVEVRSGSDLELRTSGGDIIVGSITKSLVARTSGGEINLGDVSGDISVSTSGGDIAMTNGKGELSLATSGGDIRIQSATGQVRASTSGGDIASGRIEGSIDGRTAGGEIRVELIPGSTGRTRLSSAEGDIDLAIPGSAKATIEARIRLDRRWRGWGKRNDAFSIHSDFKAESGERSDDNEIRERYIVNGGGHVITLETVNSDIHIRKLSR